ncbi:MAG: ABC transporter permease [Melioribacteraceae bacterium]|nr:ABC transporter permease [Melioribacteraceae bacterium]
MLNYFKIAYRNLFREKTYSFINIFGLALGIACTILIYKWVQDELSYDRFHENADDLYVATFSNGSTTTPTALCEFLKKEYLEIKYASRCSWDKDYMIHYGDIKANQNGGYLVDKDFFSMFTFEFVKGNSKSALNDPYSIVLSKTLAKKYFGDENPLGKIITWNVDYDLKVTGVIKDYPLNSHFDFKYFVPLELAKKWNRNLDTWQANTIQTFVQLHDNVTSKSINAKISDVVEKQISRDKRVLSLQPITELHLYDFPNGGGLITYVYIFSAMAAFILLIACINFMNLTTARSASRALEVGIRKAAGAKKSDLVKQFFSESIVLTLLSMFLGLILVVIFLPIFNSLTNKQFTIDFLINTKMVLGIIVITVITGIISGSYPALYLSHFQPVKVLKGSIRAGVKNSSLRKILVVTQFSISIFLIIGSLLILNQINFMKNKDLGIEKDNIIHMRVGSRFYKNYDLIKKQLLDNPNISHITLTNCAPYYWDSNAGLGSVFWEGQTNQQTRMVDTAVEYDFLETFNLKLSEGRFFSKEHSSDIEDAYVVNQAAIKAMEMEFPIGKELIISGRKGKIIGVLEDYNYQSLHKPVLPMVMSIKPYWLTTACLKINSHNVSETIEFIGEKYKEIYPEYEFNISSLDESIEKQYMAEEGIGKIFKYFTFLAIFISCLGLFGLSSFTAERRRKEIGIRKVLGASGSGILMLLTTDFIKWVFVANLIAWPVAWYFINNWLQAFAYRIEINIVPFVISGVLTLIISVLTVSFQTIKAALANPVESLRNE